MLGIRRREFVRLLGGAAAWPHTARILRGEKPGNMPIQRPTRLGFVLNLNTARTLGIEVLLARPETRHDRRKAPAERVMQDATIELN